MAVQVDDHDINHRGQVGVACRGLDSTRLKLNTSSSLVAPVVVLSHDRPEYLGKTLMTLLKQVYEWQLQQLTGTAAAAAGIHHLVFRRNQRCIVIFDVNIFPLSSRIC